MKKKTITFIALVDQFEGDQDLFFDTTDPETPQKLMNYFIDNVDRKEKIQVYVGELTDEQIADLLENDR